MKQKLTVKETVSIASMLFGMFFGAGNLIFPVSMGQLAGRNVWLAIAGFLITGVGLPLLGVAALGISRSGGLSELSGKVGKKYGIFFTCLLYLTIGPFFAIPRCATVPFNTGIEQLLPHAGKLHLFVFSLIFFAIVLAFSLKPGKILTWIGKILNPIFLVCLGILVIAAFLSPIGTISEIEPSEAYASGTFFKGFLEGYNTMDALAGLAFGIVVVNVIRGLGVEEPKAVAKNTVFAGIFSCLFMAVIYIAVTLIGTQSRGIYEASANGGEALAVIAHHYFGKEGALVLAAIVTMACLKTAIGLITSCSETFVAMFPNSLSYKPWAVIFCIVSFLVANLGLNTIIAYSLPVLMFLYPLAITLIFLSLFGDKFGNDRAVYGWVTGLTLVAAILDFIAALPKGAIATLHAGGLIEFAKAYLPFFSIGLGWLVPAILGLVIGLVVHGLKKE